jgi:hypothetical protein
MVSVNFKLAILTVLARWPDRRATVDEIRQEVGIIFADGDHANPLQRLSALGDIDIFQTGLVSRNEEGFQITDAGLSLLQSLESFDGAPSSDVSTAPAAQPLRLIDDLVGTEERLRIFDLELRTLDKIGFDGNDNSDRQLGQDEANWASEIEAPADDSLTGANDLPEKIDPETYEGNPTTAIKVPEGASLVDANGLPESFDPETYDAGQSDDGDQLVQTDENEPVFVAAPRVTSPDVPAFLKPSFGSKGQDPGRKSLQLANILAFVAEKRRLISGAWRRLFSETISIEKTERFVGSVGGAAFALLSLLVVVTCIGAAIALGQIKSLKSDVSVLHREVLSLRERLAKSEQAEKAKRDLDQQEEIKAEKNKPGGEIRPDQSALNLSREEIQLIKDYIKPAPAVGAAAPPINVGDPVEGAMIPLPSPLTDKVPKLIGGRFTIRNGAIIIVKRDSRQADAVLGPN